MECWVYLVLLWKGSIQRRSLVLKYSWGVTHVVMKSIRFIYIFTLIIFAGYQSLSFRRRSYIVPLFLVRLLCNIIKKIIEEFVHKYYCYISGVSCGIYNFIILILLLSYLKHHIPLSSWNGCYILLQKLKTKRGMFSEQYQN